MSPCQILDLKSKAHFAVRSPFNTDAVKLPSPECTGVMRVGYYSWHHQLGHTNQKTVYARIWKLGLGCVSSFLHNFFSSAKKKHYDHFGGLWWCGVSIWLNLSCKMHSSIHQSHHPSFYPSIDNMWRFSLPRSWGDVAYPSCHLVQSCVLPRKVASPSHAWAQEVGVLRVLQHPLHFLWATAVHKERWINISFPHSWTNSVLFTSW